MTEQNSNEKKLEEYAKRIEEHRASDTAKVSSVKDQPPVGETGPPSQKTVGGPIEDTAHIKKPWEKSKEEVDFKSQLGWQKLPIKDLPTQGLFYPEGAEVTIRSATAAEIRHWSTINENDLSAIDDMLNYIIERCAKIKYPNQNASWRDIKEVDRFYILLAIRELTFVNGENKLQVKTSESSKIDVTKDMVDYISFDERLMKYYSPEERLIILPFKTGKKIKINIPSIGITNWLKNYINRKRQYNEVIDEDFINFAPFVILDWRGLNDETYSKIIIESHNWTASEISMLTEVRRIFTDTVDPVVRYRDEEGGERTVPLSFQGGLKSIFLVSDPFGELV